MEAVLKTAFLSVDDYLSGEEVSNVRHEYVAGVVYAKAGGSDAHNTIALNLVERLRPRLRGGPCRLFAFDMKVRLLHDGRDIFYYPDVLVTCDPRDTAPYFKEYPTVVVEVLSDGTERIDRHEKFSNYIQIETLEEYILASQDRMEVRVFRRSRNWKPEVFGKPDQEVQLDSLDFKMRLEAIYENVSF